MELLKQSTASITDWGTLDIPAAIDALLIKRKQIKLFLLDIVLADNY